MSFSDQEEALTGLPTRTPPPAIDLTALIATARRFYWIVPVTMGIALAGALSFLRFAEPVYRSSAEIKVESHAGPSLSLSENSSLAAAAATFEDLGTFEHSFLNFELMERVITALNLERRDNFIAPNRPASSVTHGELMGYLMSQSKVSPVSGTRLIDISFDNWNPSTAREVANALVEQGVAYDRDQHVKALADNIKYLQEEVKNAEDALSASEHKQNDYTRTQGSISINNESNLIEMQLRDVNSSFTAAKGDRLKIESDYSQIEKYRNDPDKLISIPSVQNAPSVQELTSRINDLRGNLAKLSERYRPENPFVQQAQTELSELEQARKREVLNAPEGVKIALETARHNEESLDQERKELEDKAIQVQGMSIQTQVYQRQIDANRLSYETALKLLNEEFSQVRSQPALLQIAAPASPAIRATLQPHKIIAASAFGGLFAGIALIVMIVRFNSSIKSAESAEALLKLSALTIVPAYVPEKEDPEERPGMDQLSVFARNHCPVLNARNTPVSEAFRTLGTFLQMTEERPDNGLILMTSAQSGEGVSFCCLNLAVSLAQSGQRVLLVDANLRTPSLEQKMVGSTGHPGLSDYLQGHATLSSTIRTTPIRNLDILPSGSLSRHPADILSRPLFRSFLEESQIFYDKIIFDSTSLSTVSDTLCIARFIPFVCLVIRINRTSDTAASRALELLSRSGAHVSGLVVNFAALQSHGVYHEADLLAPLDDQDNTGDFPAKCINCGRIYESEASYLENTLPIDVSQDPKKRTGSMTSESHIRKCVCGASVILPTASRRDNTEEGLRRRQLFGDMLGELQKGGLSKLDARTKLLFVLKFWNNEISSDGLADGSHAAARRRDLFEDLVNALEAAGFSREVARSKLLHVVQTWRDTP